MSDGTEAVTARMAMDRLAADAGGSSKRLATLARVVTACDDLASGEAHRLAKKAKQNGNQFDPQFVKINSRSVHAYIKPRAHLDGPGTSWKGPWDTVIRGDKDLKAYVDLRDQEAAQGRPARPKSRGARSVEVEGIIDRIDSLTDRQTLRFALADARKWKRDYDLMQATLRMMPGLDVDELLQGRVPSKAVGAAGTDAMMPEERRMLRRLLARLRDNDALGDFELRHISGAVKMDGPPGSELIGPDEMKLLARLAGEKPGG